MESIFNPSSVAVIGASGAPGKWGFGIFARLIGGGNDRPVYPVNNRVDQILGVRTYPSLLDIPGPVELAIIVSPPETVPSVMSDCVAKGVKGAVVVTAGFAEVGEKGKAAERRVVEMAREGGIRFVGPNCMGHFNTAADLMTAGEMTGVPRGPIACISQSGNFGGYVIWRGAQMGIGFSKFVSTGNEADLKLEDYLEYLAQDDETKVITAYIEGIRDPRRFFALARDITKAKPVVVMKSGRTSEGARAAWSHTAALAGEDAIHDAMFRQCGVIRVGEADEMFDIAVALVAQPRPRGRRVAILTGGGGFGVVATDACVRLGLEIAELSPETIETLNKYLPPRWSHGNPVDMAGTSNTSYGCMGTLLKAEGVDAVLGMSCVGSPSTVPSGPDVPDAVRKAAEYAEYVADEEAKLVDGLLERVKRHDKPIVLAYAPAGNESPAVRKLNQRGFFVYPTPERAVRVLAHLVRYGEYLASVGV